MELLKTNEDLLVMEYLQKMKVNAEIKVISGTLMSEKVIWQQHLEVIKRAIEASTPEPFLAQKTA